MTTKTTPMTLKVRKEPTGKQHRPGRNRYFVTRSDGGIFRVIRNHVNDGWIIENITTFQCTSATTLESAYCDILHRQSTTTGHAPE